MSDQAKGRMRASGPRVRRKVACAALAIFSVTAVPASAEETNPLHRLIGAPEGLVIQGSIRSRSEAIDGQFRPTAAEDDFLQSFRTILFAEYDAGRIRLGGELRDARGYGQDRNSSAGVSEINALEPVQAYVGIDLEDVGSKGASGILSAGRFSLETGAGRLIGRSDFSNSITSYTGALLDWRSANKDRVVLFWAMPSTRLPNDAEGLRNNRVKWDRAREAIQFFGAHLSKANLISDVNGDAYVYRLAEEDSLDQPTRDRHLLTYGARLYRSPAAGKLDFDVEVARQTGRARNSTSAADQINRDVEAHMAHAEIGRKLDGRWSPRVSLHADFASGDDRDPAKLTRFDPLFGSTRSEFGPGGLYGLVGRANLVSGGARVELAPSKRLDGFLMYRAFWLDEATDSFASTGVRDRAGLSGRHAGSQIEGRVRYWIVPKRLRIEAGGAYLAKGRFLQDAPNAQASGDTRYGYLDLSVEF